MIYGADADDDWTDEAVWRKANPSLGVTVPIDKVRAACNSARQNPAEENTFRQLRLNQWVKQSVRWMPMHIWDAGADPVNLDELEGRRCYGGLDLASTTDITAFVLIFPTLRGRRSTGSPRGSGYRRTTWRCGWRVIMCPTTCGTNRAY